MAGPDCKTVGFIVTSFLLGLLSAGLFSVGAQSTIDLKKRDGCASTRTKDCCSTTNQRLEEMLQKFQNITQVQNEQQDNTAQRIDRIEQKQGELMNMIQQVLDMQQRGQENQTHQLSTTKALSTVKAPTLG